MSAGAPTRGEALARAAAAFLAVGFPDARLEARDLLLFVLGLERPDLGTTADVPLSARDVVTFDEAVARRLAGTPLDRLLGHREFLGRRFHLNAATLAPREDSAALIELACLLFDRDRPLRIADLGTGSGILLVTLLAIFPNATGLGTDIAPEALAMAASNADAHGVEARARFVLSDWFEQVPGTFDLLISNPPYIPAGDIAALEREVRLHDPLRALDGGVDGLDAYRAIAGGAASVLDARGLVIVEIGSGQGRDVEAIFAAAGWSRRADRLDLGGHERALAFTRADRAPDRIGC